MIKADVDFYSQTLINKKQKTKKQKTHVIPEKDPNNHLRSEENKETETQKTEDKDKYPNKLHDNIIIPLQTLFPNTKIDDVDSLHNLVYEVENSVWKCTDQVASKIFDVAAKDKIKLSLCIMKKFFNTFPQVFL